MIYHVAKSWDGSDLMSLAAQCPWSDDTADAIADKWPDCDQWEYYSTDGQYIHCHATIEDARDYRDEFCPDGEILAIDDTSEWADFRVEAGTEYPHPVVRKSISSDCVAKTM